MRGHATIHERVLFRVWEKQYFGREGLSTHDGQSLEILNPGTLNLDGGPDFVAATLRIGGVLCTGDIEIHRSSVDWVRHGHHLDPSYNAVILHVAFEHSAERFQTFVRSGRIVPLLVLRQWLSESLLPVWDQLSRGDEPNSRRRIPCYALNEKVPSSLLDAWIRKLGEERLEMKLRRFDDRLSELADQSPTAPEESASVTRRPFAALRLWEQLLYEGFLESLGFSKNRVPFRMLAQSMTLSELERVVGPADLRSVQACLFGVAGLVDDVLEDDSIAGVHVGRELRSRWEKIRDNVRTGYLHPGDWQRFPLRPGNSPVLRVAAAGGIAWKLLREDFFRSVVQSLNAPVSPAKKTQGLRGLLRVAPFRGRRLLGSARIADMIVNVILPVGLLYSRKFRETKMGEAIRELYDRLPALQSNHVTRKMEAELLRGRVRNTRALTQQGSLQLYHFFCSGARCAECDIGKAVFRRPS